MNRYTFLNRYGRTVSEMSSYYLFNVAIDNKIGQQEIFDFLDESEKSVREALIEMLELAGVIED